jgi:NAD(P)-dependent dehydrogenase (short-subunit alcohol dehydrogenase family)
MEIASHMMPQDKKTVFITGASSGIGLATARLFQDKGWNVVATMRTPEKAEALAKHDRTLVVRLDVTDIESIRSSLKEAIARFGSVDVLVNNAGYGLVGPFEASTPEQVQRQISTNVIGLMNVTREFIPLFRERRTGIVVNLSSMGGQVTFPLYSVYHATKWAVEGFSEALVYELEPFNVRVKIIEPGAIKTDFYDRSQDLMTKPGLTAYDSFVAKAMAKMQQAGATAPGPDVVAMTIFGAATDGSLRLRYPVNSASILWLRRLLPTRLFMGVVKSQVLK